MKNLIFFSLILFSIIFSTSCSKDEQNNDIDAVTIKSDIFQCCNIWSETSTDESLAEKLARDFLIDIGIVPVKITRGEGTPLALCFICCQCPTGEALFIEIDRKDLESALSFGFEED